jgi:hypothetical protein
MILFYGKNTQQLFVTPYRNGSQFLKNNSAPLHLLHFEMLEIVENDDARDTVSFLMKKAKKKIFIYRDPFEKIYSVYNTFISSVKEGIISSPDDIKTLVKNNLLLKDVDDTPSTIRNFGNFVKHLEKVYMNDFHTMPQYNYFNIMNEKIENYEVINFDSYHKMLQLYFITNKKEISLWESNRSSVFNESVKILDLEILLETRRRIQNIYKDDYNYLKPTAQIL